MKIFATNEWCDVLRVKCQNIVEVKGLIVVKRRQPNDRVQQRKSIRLIFIHPSHFLVQVSVTIVVPEAVDIVNGTLKLCEEFRRHWSLSARLRVDNQTALQDVHLLRSRLPTNSQYLQHPAVLSFSHCSTILIRDKQQIHEDENQEARRQLLSKLLQLNFKVTCFASECLASCSSSASNSCLTASPLLCNVISRWLPVNTSGLIMSQTSSSCASFQQ